MSCKLHFRSSLKFLLPVFTRLIQLLKRRVSRNRGSWLWNLFPWLVFRDFGSKWKWERAGKTLHFSFHNFWKKFAYHIFFVDRAHTWNVCLNIDHNWTSCKKEERWRNQHRSVAYSKQYQFPQRCTLHCHLPKGGGWPDCWRLFAFYNAFFVIYQVEIQTDKVLK